MNRGSIRLKSVCVLATPDAYVFAVGHDPSRRLDFLIPFGGGVEFGERSEAAAKREMSEELGLSLGALRSLGVLENVFTWNGIPGHEVVFCYLGEVRPGELPAHGVESDGTIIPLRIVPRTELSSLSLPVYPDGLLALLPT